MKDVMLDLETLGTNSDSVILSIGAVRFDADGTSLGDTFYRRVDIDSCLEYGLTLKGRTILWWLEQNYQARAAISNDPGDHIAAVLSDLSKFIQDGDRVWGNGAAFDNAVLSTAYRKLGMEVPWPYYSDRCFRTIKAMNPHIPRPVFEGIAHHALDDAVNQAKHLQAILSGLRSQQSFADKIA